MKWYCFKRGIFPFLLLIISSLNLSAEVNSIILTMKDGSKNAVALLENPILTFPKDSLLVGTSTIQLKVSRQDFSFYSFGDMESTFLGENSEVNSMVYVDESKLVIRGIKSKNKVLITDLEGRVYRNSVLKKEREYLEISLENFPTGIYLMVLDELVFKFVKR